MARIFSLAVLGHVTIPVGGYLGGGVKHDESQSSKGTRMQAGCKRRNEFAGEIEYRKTNAKEQNSSRKISMIPFGYL